MTNRRGNGEDVAKAIAFFQSCTDAALLRDVLKTIQPKAAAAARKFAGREPPNPAAIQAAPAPASEEQALHTVRRIQDFAELQAVARAVGRRVEELRSMN
jgi:hypothetical protein